jgi:outer membrane lipoprotein-sorting protein
MKFHLLVFVASSLSALYAESVTPMPATPALPAGTVAGTAAEEPSSTAGLLADASLQSVLASIYNSMFPAAAVASMRMVDYRQSRKGNESVKIKTLEMNLRTKGDSALIEMKSPAVDRGKYILKNDQGLWLYQTKIKRSIRISARDDFNGTSASNYDILEMNLIRDYDVGASTRETLDGRELLKVQLSARPGTEGYEKIVSWIDPVERIIVRNDCYAVSGTLIKTISYHDHRQIDQYRVPMRVKVDSAIRPGNYSTIEFTHIEESPDQPDHTFSLGYLESLN